MRCAEEVTFGGSGLDRADDLRGQGETLDAALAEGRASRFCRARGATGWRCCPAATRF